MSITRRLALAAFIASGAVPLAANAGTLTTLYAFPGGMNGGNPTGPLIFHDGDLYGTLPEFDSDINYLGNVYKVNAKTGHYAVVHAFQAGADGSGPVDGVIYHGGMLYGTTALGGGANCVANNEWYGCGTIFSINPKTGAESILYTFPQDSQTAPGAQGLVYLNGILYGTTAGGGANGAGSIFSYNLASGSFTTLFSFGGATGGYPNSQLLYQNGLFYGTTMYGGASCERITSCGVVFTIDPVTGSENTLYTFQEKKQGVSPFSNLVFHAGSFIGATVLGGSNACRHGCGLTFSIDAATGAEQILSLNDTIAEDASGMTLVGGNVYEAVPQAFGVDGDGNGELVEFNLNSKTSTVLYTFPGGTGGAHPMSALIYQDEIFYGNTAGFPDGGSGTVFKYTP